MLTGAQQHAADRFAKSLLDSASGWLPLICLKKYVS
jgi:hypothetical protein